MPQTKPVVDEAFAPPTIRDQQLRMMFSCCHPRLPEVAQVALVLNILCRFRRRGDRECVPHPSNSDRKTSLSWKEGPRRFQAAVRPGRCRLPSTAFGGEARPVPALQRGLSRCVRERCRAGRVVSRGHATRGVPSGASRGGEARDLRARGPLLPPRRSAPGASRPGG
jgi:hypothetical protein